MLCHWHLFLQVNHINIHFFICCAQQWQAYVFECMCKFKQLFRYIRQIYVVHSMLIRVIYNPTANCFSNHFLHITSRSMLIAVIFCFCFCFVLFVCYFQLYCFCLFVCFSFFNKTGIYSYIGLNTVRRAHVEKQLQNFLLKNRERKEKKLSSRPCRPAHPHHHRLHDGFDEGCLSWIRGMLFPPSFQSTSPFSFSQQ